MGKKSGGVLITYHAVDDTSRECVLYGKNWKAYTLKLMDDDRNKDYRLGS
jgi:hypothetical protein